MISGRLLIFATLVVAGVLAGPTRFNPSTSIDGPNEVIFTLYTQGNPSVPEIIRLDDDSTSPSFNPAHPTRVAIHGGNSGEDAVIPIKDAYIATGDHFNVILVDWSRAGSQQEDIGTNPGVSVGDFIGEVLNHLIDSRGLNPDSLSIIGISMGGQIAGIVGNRLGGIASEVIALDPASDIFDDYPLEDQLDASDAQFVQVIHTNGGDYGVLDSRGDADFYPNGGSYQVGCPQHGHQYFCDHGIVRDYFVESIASKNFVATLCSSYEDFLSGACSTNQHTVMGEWTPHTVSGSFYLETNADSPYAKGETDL